MIFWLDTTVFASQTSLIVTALDTLVEPLERCDAEKILKAITSSCETPAEQPKG